MGRLPHTMNTRGAALKDVQLYPACGIHLGISFILEMFPEFPELQPFQSKLPLGPKNSAHSSYLPHVSAPTFI